MSQKRKLEEYRDPDYPRDKVLKFATGHIKQIDQKEKICNVLSREFENEINFKEREVYEINDKVSVVRKMLHKVCFAVIYNYYNKRSLNLGIAEIAQAQETISKLFNNHTKGLQNALHPSLKKILGSNEVNYKELLISRPTRQAAKTAQTTIKEKFKTKKEIRIERQRTKVLESIQENVTVDECLNQARIVKESLDSVHNINFSKFEEEAIDLQNRFENVQKLNTDRGINLIKQLVAVGNTSKFIKKESTLDKVTHKWLIYVQSKTEFPIEKFVKKVKFYLHPSYKPNDIVEIDNPPFQIARRGWGEFLVRIQLFFHTKFQQKPVQLFHNLVLDKTLTGLQTMGSETLVELWLRSTLFSPQKLKSPETLLKCPKKEVKNLKNKKKNKSYSPLIGNNDNILDYLNQIDTSLLTDLNIIEPALILSPTTHSKLKLSETINSANIQSNTKTHMESQVEFNINNGFLDANIISENNIELISNNFKKEDEFELSFKEKSNRNVPLNIKTFNQKLKESSDEVQTNTKLVNSSRAESKLLAFNIENRLLDFCNKKNPITNNLKFKSYKNKIILKDGKVSIINPIQTKLKKRKQVSLLKPVIRPNLSNINYKQKVEFSCITDHDYTSPWKDEIDLKKKYILNETENRNGSILKNFMSKLEEPDLITNHDFISVIISNNTKQLINLKKKITLTVKEESYCNKKTFVDFRGQFELKFHSKIFFSENNLIEYCLKNIPLINSQASNILYKIAFPFVVENNNSFRALPLPKRRALEWLQCKYFSILMKNHGKFSETLWSTKEIILYSRSYGFSPESLIYDKALCGTKICEIYSINLKQIKFHQNLCTKPSQSISEVHSWINEFNKVENDLNTEKIDIDNDLDKTLNKFCFSKPSPIRYAPNSLIAPIQEKYHEESILIKAICNQLDIELKTEVFCNGVQLHASQLMLIKLLRKFIENLIRKSIFEIKNSCESIPVVQADHVKRAVLSNSDFEFLINKVHKNINKIKKELV